MNCGLNEKDERGLKSFVKTVGWLIPTITAQYVIAIIMAVNSNPDNIYIKSTHTQGGDVSYYLTSNKKIVAKRTPLARPGWGGISIDTLAEQSPEYIEITKTPEYKLKVVMRKDYFNNEE